MAFDPKILDDIRARVPVSFVAGKIVTLTKKGAAGELVGLCPFHNESTPSFTVNDEKQFFHCFGCGANGDIFAFVERTSNVPFPEAVKACAAVARVDLPKNKGPKKTWLTILPVPGDAPKPPAKHPQHGAPKMRWQYRDVDGNTLGWIYRCEPENEARKQILPLTYCQDDAGNRGWRWQGLPKPRPLYGLEILAQYPERSVLIVEGEKAADAARRLVGEELTVITWPGGVEAVKFADWESLRGKRIGIWPDADQPGYEAALDIVNHLQPIATRTKVILPPADAPRGWDLADAEVDGWSGVRVLQHLRDNQVDGLMFKPPPRPVPPALAPPPIGGADEVEPPPPQHTQPLNGQPFKPLGYDEDSFFFYSGQSRQTVRMSASGMTKTNLFRLAPLAWWESEYGDTKHGPNWDAAANHLINACFKCGVFDVDRIRGRGLSWDKGRVVIHLGDKLVVDGKEYKLGELETDYIYQAATSLGVLHTADPMGDDEAARLIGLCDKLPFYGSDMGFLFAGGLMIAPLCGALKYRPHFWLIGPSGSGKSYAMNAIVKPILGGMALAVQSKTTEAGVRAMLKQDARPVLFDEAEPGEKRDDVRMQMVVELARVASDEDGAPIVKGSRDQRQVQYKVLSCFFFSSINKTLNTSADENRWCVLQFVAPPGEEADEDIKEQRALAFKSIKDEVRSLITPDFGARLFARGIKLLPVIRHNAEIFADVIAEMRGSRRVGNTLGTAIAGAIALQHGRMMREPEVRDWLLGQKWIMAAAERLEVSADHERCLSYLMQYICRVQVGNASAYDRTIAELIMAATSGGDDRIPRDVANDELLRKGIRCGGEIIWLANVSEWLSEVYSERPAWAAGWKDALLSIPSAQRGPAMRFKTYQSRSIGLPLRLCVGPTSELIPPASPNR